ncbi:pre-mRNA cleavage factor Im 25 kDa subunit 1 isoform X1 [Eutrema salsugineum]|uniref:pre-mRNA cleavage factor Im 25 kDa subunit 1 isoform X1 n=1 Tax=Eutrema salsugineum TaxID=72664 RepID=UPI000CECFE42|nr:pre-mRNA cleavage factor Im 25 kDa subunit 1 isoform X1 [Eutrema salsugineum]
MGEEARVLDMETSEENATRRNHLVNDLIVDLYPLSSYYFGSRDALRVKDENISDRVDRLKSNYAAHGLRTCVEAVLLVELFKHPHALLLQYRNSIFKLPGGRLRPGESGLLYCSVTSLCINSLSQISALKTKFLLNLLDIEGLKRKLASKLSINENVVVPGSEVGECIGMWWRPNFESLMYPFLPPNVKHPKECTKLFLVRLPVNQQFVVPKNFKLLAVPLCQIHENEKTYGPIISQIPKLLSRFSFNMMEL